MSKPINSAHLHVKEGDTLPTLEDTLEDKDGTPIDLRSADEVRVYMAHMATGDLIVNDQANITSATSGDVSYQFTSNQTAREGRHLVEWVIYENGDTKTIPPDTFVAVDIHEPVDREADPEEFDDQDISVSVLTVDEIRASDDEITISDAVQFGDDVHISDLEITDDGSEAALSYGDGDGLSLDESGVSAPEPSSDDHVARLADVSDQELEDHDHQGDFLLPDTVKVQDDETIEVGVPSDYDTLAEAIADVAKYQLPSDVGVEITLESDHVITENVVIEDANLGHVTIVSEDATVDVDTDFTGHIFEGYYSTLPTLDCTIDMGNNGENGYYLRTCRLKVTSDNGIQNAGHRGVEVRDTVFDLSGTDFSGAENRCYNITRASMGSVTHGTGNDAGEHGLFVSRAAQVNAIEGTFNGNGEDGVKVQRAWCGLESAEATGNAESGLWCLGASVIDARFADFSGNSSRSIRATDGANNITADYADLSNPGHACVDASNESAVSATEAELQDSEWPAAVRARSGASVTINESDVTGYSEEAVRCETGSIVRTHDVVDDGADLDSADTNIGEFNSISTDGIIFN